MFFLFGADMVSILFFLDMHHMVHSGETPQRDLHTDDELFFNKGKLGSMLMRTMRGQTRSPGALTISIVENLGLRS